VVCKLPLLFLQVLLMLPPWHQSSSGGSSRITGSSDHDLLQPRCLAQHVLSVLLLLLVPPPPPLLLRQCQSESSTVASSGKNLLQPLCQCEHVTGLEHCGVVDHFACRHTIQCSAVDLIEDSVPTSALARKPLGQEVVSMYTHIAHYGGRKCFT
jgi:hypothetical protein